MGFNIPEPYAWDESFRVDYDKLDSEHQGLFKGIFDCAGAPGDAGKLSALVIAVDSHFKTEEDMMSGYADLEAHKKIHDEFLGKIKGLSAPLDGATIDFAKSWLVNHIKGTDFKYKGKLQL